MPEGDNVHRHAAEFGPLLVGERIARALVKGLDHPALRGKLVEQVEARGKHLLIRVEGGVTIRVHLGINGRWQKWAPSQLQPWKLVHAQLVLETERIALVCVRARAVELLRTAFLREHPPLAGLGPDLLREPVDLDEILRRARAPERSEMLIGELLLDQRAASGLGNVYKSELLFLHRLSPDRRVRELDDTTLRKLYDDGRKYLAANLLGPRITTLAPELRARGFQPPNGRRHHVYGRAQRPCPVCGTTIRVRLDGKEQPRRTFFCPSCQR